MLVCAEEINRSQSPQRKQGTTLTYVTGSVICELLFAGIS